MNWSKVWGQPVVIENRAGANGAIAAGQLAKLPADGQTLMMILSGHITNPFLYPNLGFDPLKDITPVSLVASSPLAIVANPNFPPSDIKSLVAAAKEKPNTISYATPGVASIQQLSLELMAFMTGTKFVHVPYRGGAPALNDAVGGHVPLAVLSDLIARAVAVPTAMDIVLQLARSGVRDADLSTFQRNVRADIEHGADPTAAATTRARGLVAKTATRGGKPAQ